MMLIPIPIQGRLSRGAASIRRFASSSSSSSSQRRAYEHYFRKNSSVHDNNIQLAYASVPLYSISSFVKSHWLWWDDTARRFEKVGSILSTTTTTAARGNLSWQQQSAAKCTQQDTLLLGQWQCSRSYVDRVTKRRLKSWPSKSEENGRLITVCFDSTGGDVLPWTFVPVQLDVKVVPGETALSFFRVINLSDHPIMAVTTYNEQPEEEKKKTRKENKIQPGSDGEPKSLVSTMRSGFVKLIYCGIIADAISFLGQVSKLDVAHEVFDDYRAIKMAISTEEREKIKHSANDKGDHESREKVRREGGDDLFLVLYAEHEVDCFDCTELTSTLHELFSYLQ